MSWTDPSRRPKRSLPRAAIGASTIFVLGLTLGWFLSSAVFPRKFAVSRNRFSLPRGTLMDTVYIQGLSHRAFHAPEAKRVLASLVASPTTSNRMRPAVAVVGVEWGTEVQMFAEDGYTVHAFEPMKLYHDKMQLRMATNNRRAEKGLEKRWDVRLHKLAAGAGRDGKLTVQYGVGASRLTETVRRGRVDDFVKEELDVLSVDIQGHELDVLQGATGLLGRKVRSLWVEIAGCNPKTLGIFKLLDRHYVIFDFVPWGPPWVDGLPKEPPVSLTGHKSFLREDRRTRPGEFAKFFKWFCSKTKHQRFRWIQSDILAVRRDLVTPEFVVKMSTLGNDILVAMREKEQTMEKARKKKAT